MPIGKSLRFEVFARDGFTCQYCGARPPDVILEVDHIHPVSKGGTDDTINLITSCYDCNRGKRAKVISAIAPRPDADLAMLKIQQESLEIERFLKAKKKRDRQLSLAVTAAQEEWCKYLTPGLMPNPRVILPWLERYGIEEVLKSIRAAVPSYSTGRFGRDERSVFQKLLPWVGAILRNRERNSEEVGSIQ
jgi:hypothetical protein